MSCVLLLASIDSPVLVAEPFTSRLAAVAAVFALTLLRVLRANGWLWLSLGAVAMRSRARVVADVYERLRPCLVHFGVAVPRAFELPFYLHAGYRCRVLAMLPAGTFSGASGVRRWSSPTFLTIAPASV